MNPLLLFVGFCVLAAIWTVIWGWVLFNARHPISYPQVEANAATLRRRLVYLAVLVVIAVFAVSIYWLPYPFVRASVFGPPTVKVNVQAQQWAWTFSQNKFPLGVTVEFDVTSRDVNHGFGLYDPRGRLVAQVQAMPGYTNHLIFTFEQPGTYIVRCLELCGTPHYLMQSQLTVTR
jgi:cytochrome c oxidase subunit 2